MNNKYIKYLIVFIMFISGLLEYLDIIKPCCKTDSYTASKIVISLIGLFIFLAIDYLVVEDKDSYDNKRSIDKVNLIEIKYQFS